MITHIKYICFLADERHRIKDRQNQYLDFARAGYLQELIVRDSRCSYIYVANWLYNMSIWGCHV